MICHAAAGARPGNRCGIPGARIDRLDLEAVIGLADQLLEGRALQHAIDQLAPVRLAGRRKIGGQSQIVGLGRHVGTCLPGVCYRDDCGAKCHVATAKPNGCFPGYVSYSAEGSGRIPSRETRLAASSTRRPAIRRAGAISASGTSTKPRSNSRGCGKRQIWPVDGDIVIGDQVEVERARTPPRLLRAIAAEHALDVVQNGEQVMRRDRGVDRDAGVDEGRLLLLAPGRSDVVGRAPRPAKPARAGRSPGMAC